MSSEFPSAGTPVDPVASPPSDRDRVIDALMRLASDRPWGDIELSDIAAQAGLSLSRMRDLFPSKGAILEGYTRRIDKAIIDATVPDLAGEPARERLFDILMRRLDAMTADKAALRRISHALRGDLVSLAALNRTGLNSARYMLAAAGIPTEGPLGQLKLQGTVIALARVMEVWFDDEDPTGAKTLAALDLELGRGERLLDRADDLRRLTAPLRAFGQALRDGRTRVRRRRDRRIDPNDGDTLDPAAAI